MRVSSVRSAIVTAGFIGLALLHTSIVHAQPFAPPCVIERPQQRAIWDRMKAENHPWYQQIKFNTTWDRYADVGRWEGIAGRIDRDRALLARTYNEWAAATNNWTTVWRGNESREMTIEAAAWYGCAYPYLSLEQRSNWRNWLIKVADGIVSGVRTGDSDQTTGNYFGLALIDKVLGTMYISGTYIDPNYGTPLPVGGLTATACDLSTMRNAICYYTKLAKGGQWIEASAGYDLGTVQLLLMGAYWTGIENFQEVAQFAVDFARWLPNFVTPDLKDALQSGDNEHPHQLQIAAHMSDLISFLAAIVDDAAIAARLRQFEADLYAANGQKGPTPLYARYFYTANPYAPKLPWREWAGTSFYAEGQGHLYARTSTSATARATWMHCPTFRKGAVDHFQAFSFCDVRHFRNGRFSWDRPLGYGPDQIFSNTMIVGARTHPGVESTDVVGQSVIEGKIAFLAGAEAGHTGTHTTFPAYGKAKPFLHEKGRYLFDLLDGEQSVIVTLDRIHADDPRTLTENNSPWGTLTYEQMFIYQAQRQAVDAVPQIVEHLTQTPVAPTFSADRKTFSWQVATTTASMQQVLPREPLVREVIDQKAMHCNNFPVADRTLDNCFSGYMPVTEMKYVVKGTRPIHQIWSTYAHCYTALESGYPVTCEPIETTEGDPVFGVRVVRGGRDVVVVASGKQGPKQLGYYVRGASNLFETHADPTRIDRVVAARRLTDVRLTLDGDADVYVADLDPSVSTITINGQLIPVTRHGDLAVVSDDTPLPAPPLPAPPQPAPPQPSPTCTYTVAPKSLTIAAAGGSLSVTVTKSDPSCDAAVTNALASPWATSTIDGSLIRIAVQPNTGTASRYAMFTIGGSGIIVMQAAGAGTSPLVPALREVNDHIGTPVQKRSDRVP